MAGHTAGDPLECYSIPIVLHKEPDQDEHGNLLTDMDGKQRYRCGFKIGGGIDQDPSKSPQGYPDNGIYITHIHENGPAHHAGLQIHDKILQVNGNDFTLVTHKKAIDYIKRKPVLNLLVYRKGVPQLHKPQQPPHLIPQHQHSPSHQPMQHQPVGGQGGPVGSQGVPAGSGAMPQAFQQQPQFQTFGGMPGSPQMQQGQFQQRGY